MKFYDQRTKNLHNKFELSQQARILLKAIDDVQVGHLSERELRCTIRYSPSRRSLISESIAQIAAVISRDPACVQDGTILIQLFTKILNIADNTAEDMFPFMNLPREVRELIYGLYLRDPFYRPGLRNCYPGSKKTSCTCSFTGPPPQYGHRKMWMNNTMALSETCKAIRSEFMVQMYRGRAFYFNCTCEMQHYLTTQPLLCQNIQTIKFHWCGPKSDEAFLQLRKCASLRRLVVVPSQATTRYLNKRQRLFATFFTQNSKTRLSDALGIDELIRLRGVERVEAVNISAKIGHRRTGEEVANLNALLKDTVMKSKEDGYDDDDSGA